MILFKDYYCFRFAINQLISRMPAKDMKQFLHDFFNPPKFAQPVEAKRRTAKKKVKKKSGLTPIQKQLLEADEFMKYKVKEYEACTTGRQPPPS